MNTLNPLECCLIVLILVIHQSVIAAEEFATDGQPYNVTISKGESVKFDCRVTGLLPRYRYSLHWKFNDVFVGHEKHVIIKSIQNTDSTVGSTLTVIHGESTDQGFYECEVYKDGLYAFTSRKGFLKVELNLLFRRQPSDKDVVTGHNMTLGCAVYNFDDTLTIKWFRRGKIISQGYNITHSDESDYGDLKIGGDSGSGVFDLIISNVTTEIGGKFQCKVFRKGKKKPILQSTTAKITVMYPPDREYPLCNSSSLNESFFEGDVIETTCWARGGNAPLYFEWIQDEGSSNGTLQEGKGVYIWKSKWNLTANDNGKQLLCKMKGVAVTTDRQCSIGPIYVDTRKGFGTNAFTVVVDKSYSTKHWNETNDGNIIPTLNVISTKPPYVTGKHKCDSQPSYDSKNSLLLITISVAVSIFFFGNTIACVCLWKRCAINSINKDRDYYQGNNIKDDNSECEDQYEDLHDMNEGDYAELHEIKIPSVTTQGESSN